MATLPPLRQMISALIGTPSVSSVVPAHDTGNRAVIELLATWLDDLGFEIELQPLPGRDDKLNLIARRGGTAPDGLVLAGHTDTVPCDPALWRHGNDASASSPPETHSWWTLPPPPSSPCCCCCCCCGSGSRRAP